MEVRRSTLRHQRRKQVVHDSVSPAAATAFCRHEPDYHCVNCDSQRNKFSQAGTSHDGVLICAACERAPAVVTCLADAASLCLVCDAEIHSASSLASRHRRTPILHLPPTGGSDILAEKTCINPIMKDFNKEDGFFPGEEVDQYLDLAELDDLGTEFFPMGSERAVPLNLAMTEEQQQQLQQKHQLDASAYPLVGYSAAINNSASLSSMELSMVPDDAATAINSFSNTSMSLLPGELLAGYHQRRTPLPQFSPGDREARVLRYREKKKARNFEKTIRYASRKAYAEARPRIRGRFARRSHVETDAEKKHCGSAAAEGGYGIVPSFS